MLVIKTIFTAKKQASQLPAFKQNTAYNGTVYIFTHINVN